MEPDDLLCSRNARLYPSPLELKLDLPYSLRTAFLHFVNSQAFEIVTSAIAIRARDFLTFKHSILIRDARNAKAVRGKPEKALQFRRVALEKTEWTSAPEVNPIS